MNECSINCSVRKELIKNTENPNTESCLYCHGLIKNFFGTWGDFLNSIFPYSFIFAKGPKSYIHSNFSKHLQLYKEMGFFSLILPKFQNFSKAWETNIFKCEGKTIHCTTFKTHKPQIWKVKKPPCEHSN